MIERMDMQTKDLSQEKIRMLGELFPDCITESKEGDKVVLSVDFDALRQDLSDHVVEGPKERYQFTWPDKNKARVLANTPTTNTLRPCREESVDFDTTKNLYIEGDNLEVLKILRETYLGKVKMIYIDPPYNTGSDFIYFDSFSMSNEDYKLMSGEMDENGNIMKINSDNGGFYHTNWLNMIYPRLMISKDFLSDDGILFISIGINEVSNLKKICDELFGERNFVSQISWVSKSGGSADEKTIINAVEYILVYAKKITEARLGKLSLDVDSEKYKLMDEYMPTRGKYLLKKLDYRMTSKHYTESLNYPIIDPDGNELWPGGKTVKQNDGWNWRWSQEKVKWGFSNGFLQFVKGKNGWTLNSKQYQKVDNKGNPIDRSIAYRNYFTNSDFNTSQGSKSITELFGTKIFEYAKPVGLLKRLMEMCSISDTDCVLDFFSGSGTIAQAVIEYNQEYSKDIHYIAVQIPQKIELNSQSIPYDTICELAKERIRRVGKKVAKESESKTVDLGYRVFKLHSSNMSEVFYNPSALQQRDLVNFRDNVKPERNEEDLLIQSMLELGIELSVKIETKYIENAPISLVDDGYLVACLSGKCSESIITAIAKMEVKPVYAVIRNGVEMTDQLLSNIEQIFKTYSPDTTIRLI